jgi:hypothetical protein
MFVRTSRVKNKDTGKVYEYRQIVRSVWGDGGSRHQVVAHLGSAETNEEKVGELRDKLSPLIERYDKRVEEEAKYRRRIERYFGEALDKYHGGEIPTFEEHQALSGGHYLVARVCTPEQRGYRRDFGRVHFIQDYRNQDEQIEAFGGFNSFTYWHGLWEFEAQKAAALKQEVDRLRDRIERLETVQAELTESLVTKVHAAQRSQHSQ